MAEDPKNWTEHKAPDGRTYFYNSVTKVTRFYIFLGGLRVIPCRVKNWTVPKAPASGSRLTLVRLRPKIKKNATYLFLQSLFLTFEGIKSSNFDKN